MDLMLDSLVTENMCKMSFRTFIQFVMVNNRIISLEKIVRMQQNKIAKLNQKLEDSNHENEQLKQNLENRNHEVGELLLKFIELGFPLNRDHANFLHHNK